MGSAFDVIIVGGGAAGIGAARQLAAHGSSALLLEASSRLGGRAHTQEIDGYPLDLGCEWLHSGDRNAWVGIAETSGFPVDRGEPPWTKAHPGITQDEDAQEAGHRPFRDREERLRAAAAGGERAREAVEAAGTWNAEGGAIDDSRDGDAAKQMFAA